MGSIRARLLLAASAVLLAFIGLCGWGLEAAFQNSAKAAQQDRLQGMVYALLGAADQDEAGRLTVNSDTLPDPRLRQPQSGLEAALLDEAGGELWRSPSAAGALPVIIGPEVGRTRLERIGESGPFVLAYGLRWIGTDQVPKRYTVSIIEEPGAYDEQLGIFRKTLWAWLLASALALLLSLFLVQYWGLLPLKQLVGELRVVEQGNRPQIENPYPRELEPLTGALNAMIRSERSQQARYRNALGDLAHSLKTPLAVLRGHSGSMQRADRIALDDKLNRMQEIVDHQLGRAALAGRRTLAQPVPLAPIARQIELAIGKVYVEKGLRIALSMSPTLQLRADRGDLYELLGNLLDNAAKWARSEVALAAEMSDAGIVIRVEDDGPGFPPDPNRLLGRGIRADSRTPGQGLGLAAVAEMVSLYEGTIELDRSEALGGARVKVQIPA